MPLADARRQLAKAQADLLHSLKGLALPPADFEPAMLQATTTMLRAKRRREAAHAWPALATALNDSFVDLFDAFAARTPLPQWGGPMADGYAFADHLLRSGMLPEAGRIERLRTQLHYVLQPTGLLPRRGSALRLAFMPQSRRLLIAIRDPWSHVFSFSIPLAWTLGLPTPSRVTE